jgi:tRNA threonylcarbamoyladenosine biosynthesis protein TsaB
MIVLGFDTATPATAVALRLADGSTYGQRHDPLPGERPGHATQLLPVADQLLVQAGLGWEAVERIAVGVGPGTFTGLRVGVATARALAQSLAVDLVGISSLQALAQAVVPAGECDGGVLAVIDARRGETFMGAYLPAQGRQLLAPRTLAPEDFGTLPAPVGEDGADGRWLAVGDGAVRYRSQLEQHAIEVPPDSSPLHFIDAACICELALRAHPPESGAVVPDYLRRPDAELALEGAARSMTSVNSDRSLPR